jgi:quercetin dioxygenase-like cupin family protein
VTLLVRESTETRFEVEATYAPHSARAPKHWHPHHDESFEVLSGTLHIGPAGKEDDFTLAPRSTSRAAPSTRC